MEKFICRKIRQLLLMLMALILCLASVPAAAVDGAARPTEGLCIHHPAHDAACGYQEGTPAQPCNHVHDAACGYREPIGEVPCDQGCADADGDGQIDHAAGCAYRPAQEAQPCNHVHDAACGYRAAGPASPCAYAQAGCPYCVRAWDWMDPLGALTQAEQGWVLALPGVGPEQPLTRDAAASLLPAQINATLQNGQPASLDLSWDLSAIPEAGAAAGEYPVLASLADPTYALPQGDALSITLQAGGAQTYALEMPSGEPLYADHIVQGISPLGTTIHLFDYWLDSQTAADNGINNQQDFLSKGINNDHALLFGKGMGGNENNIGEWNRWTKDATPYPDIVKSNLGDDGYPQLNLTIPSDTALTTTDGNQSLAYLFNPKMQADGKASYPNVKGLLQVDENGYYYYDSGKNYAVYYQADNSFVLYDHPGVKNNGGGENQGNFFPFNAATADPDTSDGGLMSTVSSIDASINHYFGVHMSTRFIQLNGGKIGEDSVIYEFSGDDDVWVFIDGVLVADLGGIHDAASVNIDFSTGKITINGTEQEKTLGALLDTGSNTLADNTRHTLDFFYLERGNVDSHMELKYNLVTQPESSLIKIDQLGNPVPGAKFSLYAADNLSTAIATGTTDREGRFIFMDPANSTPLTIQGLYNKYKDSKDDADNNLIVEETYTPAGYRTIDQVGLYFCESVQGEVLLLSNSIWDKGAYAMPKVTVSAPGSIKLLETETQEEEAISLENDPLMFAVVYQKQGEDDWRPVYGDPIHGWHVEPDSNWDSVLRAAKANPYVFQLTSEGSYQVTIENLPGDIETYYYICNDETTAKYTVAYYYTEANNLDEATEENTRRIDSQNKDHPLTRIFSMDLYITNIKNRLLVQKVDQAGKPLAGAEFTLYKAGDANVENGAVTIKADAAAYDTLQTEGAGGSLGLEGGGLFPTPGNVLEKGEYYLVETSAPDGYKPNPAAVHIIVDDTGVYADAGQPGDGISVLRGVGSVIKSMVQFAAEDDVDATLQDIKAALATSVTLDETSGQFTVSDKGIDWGSEGQDILHLQYDNANKLLDYGLYDAPATVTLDDVTLETEAGWSKLLIRQCYQHDPATGSSLKTNLGEQDITDLFSGTVTVRVANDRAEGLTIAKTVTGNTAPAGESYQIEICVKDDGKPISGSYDTVSGAGESGSITFKEGKATDSLQAGESLTIFDLPNGASYTVTEAQSQEQAYTTMVRANGELGPGHMAKGILTADGQTVRFINAYPTKPGGHDPGHEDEPKPTPPIPGSLERPPATGDGSGQGWPWGLLAASLAALALAWKRCPQTRSRG
ncbi:MAG TPA: fibro-slime domain-containing protein [Candidatus Pelethousia gallinarum]|nr:fibro-slime domain-containing protein [Candidatus Pelethousia gallinarum]